MPGVSKRPFFLSLVRVLAFRVPSSLLSQFVGDQCLQKKPQLLWQKNEEYVIVDGTRTLQLLYNLYYWYGVYSRPCVMIPVLICPCQVHKRCGFIDNSHHISREGDRFLGQLYVVYSLSVHFHPDSGALDWAARCVIMSLLNLFMSR